MIMKKFICFLAIFIMALSMISAYAEEDKFTMGNPDTTNWFEWDTPDDEAAFGTAIDASFNLDAPAGKHGFVKADGNKLVFEDGTPARFWGTNVGIYFTLGETIYNDAPTVAARIARCGYNIVRIHAIDLFTSGNIFGEEHSGTTRKLDEKQLDKVFFLVSELKKKGVYLYIDLTCYRPSLYKDDEIPFGDQFPSSGFKGVGMFDDYLIELQNEFATNYLTPVNPYTGLALKDDPAVVAIGVSNESGIMGLGQTGFKIPRYYLAELQGRFNRYLKGKYLNRAELEKAWKEEGRNGLGKEEDFADGTVLFTEDFDKRNYSEARYDDAYAFLYETQVNFYKVTHNHIRNVIKAKSLISGSSIGQTWGTVPGMLMAAREVSEVCAQNLYKSHPTGLGVAKITPWISPTVRSGQELFQHAMVNRPANIPFFVTEWQACPPSHHAPEHWLMLAVRARMYDIHPINYLLLNYPMPEKNSAEIIGDGFQTWPNAMTTSVSPFAAMIYHRDNIEKSEDVFIQVQYKDELLRKDTYEEPVDRATFYNWHVTPWNLWPYGQSEIRYPDLGDDVSGVNHIALDNMYKKFRTNDIQSEQINWNQDTGLFRFTSEYTNAACGFVGGLTIDMKNCIFELDNQSATIGITSCTKKTFENTDRYLIALVGRSRNKGERLDDDTASAILEGGTGPQILEAITGDITLKISENIKVYSLNSSGARESELPVTVTDEGYKKIHVGPEYKTAYYEVVKGE